MVNPRRTMRKGSSPAISLSELPPSAFSTRDVRFRSSPRTVDSLVSFAKLRSPDALIAQVLSFPLDSILDIIERTQA
jgi:hypothetical protein